MKLKAHIKRDIVILGEFIFSYCGRYEPSTRKVRWADKNTPKDEICKACLKSKEDK